MTASEAFKKVEDSLTSLNHRGRFGPLVGIEAVGPVARFHGSRWDAIEEMIDAGWITTDEYCDKAVGMIEEFRRRGNTKPRTDLYLAELKKQEQGNG